MALIDALTRDLLETTAHDWATSTSPTREGCLMRLLTEAGSCFWDLTFGSTLHELARMALRVGVEREAEDRARAALQPLLDVGELTELAVVATRTDRNRLELAVRARDAGRRPLSFTLFVQV